MPGPKFYLRIWLEEGRGKIEASGIFTSRHILGLTFFLLAEKRIIRVQKISAKSDSYASNIGKKLKIKLAKIQEEKNP